MKTILSTTADNTIGLVHRRVFGNFVEHLGRCVYEGIYDPGSPHSDATGFRTDVIKALRRLGVSTVRYPGGNFVSAYDWRDGIGPCDKRPARVDFAWQSLESNAVGIDEFVSWCKRIDAEPMAAVNLGTLGPAEAAAMLEYCNLDTPTQWVKLRKANGFLEPHGIKLWCLGNEMDGPWQAGQVPAHEYALRANATSKLLKGLDPTIQTIAAGSSGRFMPTYLEWDRQVLERCWDTVDYISAHRYSNNHANNTAEFLAEGVEIDRVISDYAGLIDYVRGLKRSEKRVYLSFDEWNVWYRQTSGDGRWETAPHLLEELYNLEDALVVAQYLNAFIRRADVVKMACLAQAVNVIAPLMTTRDALLKQTNFYPVELIQKWMIGASLRLNGGGAMYKAGKHGEVPVIDSAATFDMGSGRVAISVVNRSVDSSHEVRFKVLDRNLGTIAIATQLTGKDAKQTNTFESPTAIVPQPASASVEGNELHITLPSMSHAVVCVETRER